MTLKEKVLLLETKDFNWFTIANILDITYDKVRYISEHSEE